MIDPDLLLPDEVGRARVALAAGDLDRAAAVCAGLLTRFPGYAAAWRLLGDAERGRGDARAAGRAYAAALARDPRLPEAWLCYGLLAEERGRLDDALAYCQVAWEQAPERADLRSALERLAGLRFGIGGALELSRPALAVIHLRAGRRERAAREYTAALTALPDRLDLHLGLAESLWGLGHDDDAEAICVYVLATHPEVALALLILAEIERGRGASVLTDDLRRRLLASDPDGALAGAAVAAHSRVTSS